MKKILLGLFVFGFLAIGAQANAIDTFTPYLTVTSPNNGYESIELGKKVEIRWNSNVAINALVDVYVSDGVHKGPVVRGTNNGSLGLIYTLTGDLVPGSNYKAYVNILSENPIGDSSDYPFTIKSSVDLGCNGTTYSSTTGQACPAGTVTIGLPDLVITDFSWTPENPVSSSSVITDFRFFVTIKNIGTGSVVLPPEMRISIFKNTEFAAGLALGTAYYLLNPGDTQKFEVKTTQSPIFLNYPGTYTLTASVDNNITTRIQSDSGLIKELNENNNTLTKKIIIKSSVDLGCNGTTYSSTTGQACPAGTVTPSITVLSPKGGETYIAGQQITVKWESKNVVASIVGIMLVDSNNLTTATTIVYPTLNDGIETITLPEVSGQNFKIFITNDQTGGAYSNTFKIVKLDITPVETETSSVTVISPNGGEIYKVGDIINFKWKSNNVPENSVVTIALVDEIGSNFYLLNPNCFTSSPCINIHNGNFNINIPNTILPGSYKARVVCNVSGSDKACTYTGYEDLSDNYFTIKPAINTTVDHGCSAGQNYSSTTGKPCSTVVIKDDGCMNGYNFSSVTGKACSGYTNVNTYQPASSINAAIPIQRTLRIGIRGDDVKRLQEFLNLLADGSFGPKTAAKVKEWQAANGLTSDGLFGRQSLIKSGLTN